MKDKTRGDHKEREGDDREREPGGDEVPEIVDFAQHVGRGERERERQ